VIDLKVVSRELKDLETEIANTDETIADFCQQLNISTPF
jgi:type I restriction enzyme M protein